MELLRPGTSRAAMGSFSIMKRLPLQEETVAELRTVESEAASYLDQISRYEGTEPFLGVLLGKGTFWGRSSSFAGADCAWKNLGTVCLICSLHFPNRYYITRAKLVSKIAKYPHVVSKWGSGALQFTCCCFLGLFRLLHHCLNFELGALWEKGGLYKNMQNIFIREEETERGDSFVKGRTFS